METASTVIMVKDVFDSDADVFVEFICIDDDTTMMSHLRPKSKGGNLPDYMPLNFPIRISDLNHRIRSISHVVFELARSKMDSSCVTIFTAYRYKKALSYYIYGMFEWGDKNFPQLLGTAMGTSSAVTWTTAYFGTHEIQISSLPTKIYY